MSGDGSGEDIPLPAESGTQDSPGDSADQVVAPVEGLLETGLEGSEQLGDSGQDDWMPAEGTRNIEKTEREGHDADGAYDLHAGFYKGKGRREEKRLESIMLDEANQAGDKYELEALAEREGKSAKEVRQRMERDIHALLDYGLAIISNQREYGEALSPRQQAFEIIAEFLKARSGDAPGLFLSGKSRDEKKDFSAMGRSTGLGIIPFRITTTASGEDADVSGSLSETSDDDSGSIEETYIWNVSPWEAPNLQFQDYRIATSGIDQDGFDTVRTTKTRSTMKPEDVEKLREQLQDLATAEEAAA